MYYQLYVGVDLYTIFKYRDPGDDWDLFEKRLTLTNDKYRMIYQFEPFCYAYYSEKHSRAVAFGLIRSRVYTDAASGKTSVLYPLCVASMVGPKSRATVERIRQWGRGDFKSLFAHFTQVACYSPCCTGTDEAILSWAMAQPFPVQLWGCDAAAPRWPGDTMDQERASLVFSEGVKQLEVGPWPKSR